MHSAHLERRPEPIGRSGVPPLDSVAGRRSPMTPKRLRRVADTLDSLVGTIELLTSRPAFADDMVDDLRAWADELEWQGA